MEVRCITLEFPASCSLEGIADLATSGFKRQVLEFGVNVHRAVGSSPLRGRDLFHRRHRCPMATVCKHYGAYPLPASSADKTSHTLCRGLITQTISSPTRGG